MSARDRLAKRLCEFENDPDFDWDQGNDEEREAYYEEADTILREIVQPMLAEAYTCGLDDEYAKANGIKIDHSPDGADAYAARIIADLIATMGEWQKIETAPKDGTRVMVWDGRKPIIIRADDILAKPYWLDYATHWMPLPPPPSED